MIALLRMPQLFLSGEELVAHAGATSSSNHITFLLDVYCMHPLPLPAYFRSFILHECQNGNLGTFYRFLLLFLYLF
jgi:hypothetical protein